MTKQYASNWLVSLGSAMISAAALLSPPDAVAGKPGGGGSCTTTIPVVNTYNGRATAVELSATVLQASGGAINVGPVKISDTGELGPTSSETQKEAHLVIVDVPLPSASSPTARVQAGILDALTKSMGNTTTSWANIVGLDLDVADTLSVTAELIQSTATAAQTQPASCPAGSATGDPVGSTAYTASSSIANLQIWVAGTPISVPADAPPNTVIEVPDLVRIVLNEQFLSGGRQVVNAVHISLGGALSPLVTAEVILAHADAGIAANCGVPTTECQPGCKARDFVTGGGWITLSGGAKGTFGFNGGYKPNGLQGHLTYVDHGSGEKITGTDVTAYSGTGTARDVTYTCSISAGGCVLGVSDNGEPGAGVDGFRLSSDPYTVTGPYITHGNIQLHKSSCPAAASGKPGKNR